MINRVYVLHPFPKEKVETSIILKCCSDEYETKRLNQKIRQLHTNPPSVESADLMNIMQRKLIPLVPYNPNYRVYVLHPFPKEKVETSIILKCCSDEYETKRLNQKIRQLHTNPPSVESADLMNIMQRKLIPLVPYYPNYMTNVVQGLHKVVC